ncbi:hypothetical protein ACWGDE_02215 [Streptomyces sp. NPDC054956]
MFGRNKPVEPPMEAVGWEQAGTFVISDVERPLTRKRKRAVTGPRAVRVPVGTDEQRAFAPCAYVGPRPALTLDEDPEAQRLLCSVDAPDEVSGERHHAVLDAQGQLIGTLRRIPPKRPFKHTWRPSSTSTPHWAATAAGRRSPAPWSGRRAPRR